MATIILEKPKFITTELGLEKLCIHCDDYYPLDDEFWFRGGKNKKGGVMWCAACKGCYDERYARRKHAPKSSQIQQSGGMCSV